MLLSIEELNKMKNIDVKQIDREKLVDIRTIQIDEEKPVEARIEDYIKAVHNPFLVKIGDYIVKFTYQDSGEEIDERILSYIEQITKIDF